MANPQILSVVNTPKPWRRVAWMVTTDTPGCDLTFHGCGIDDVQYTPPSGHAHPGIWIGEQQVKSAGVMRIFAAFGTGQSNGQNVIVKYRPISITSLDGRFAQWPEQAAAGGNYYVLLQLEFVDSEEIDPADGITLPKGNFPFSVTSAISKDLNWDGVWGHSKPGGQTLWFLRSLQMPTGSDPSGAVAIRIYDSWGQGYPKGCQLQSTTYRDLYNRWIAAGGLEQSQQQTGFYLTIRGLRRTTQDPNAIGPPAPPPPAGGGTSSMDDFWINQMQLMGGIRGTLPPGQPPKKPELLKINPPPPPTTPPPDLPPQ